jgi:hypothetical protein
MIKKRKIYMLVDFGVPLSYITPELAKDLRLIMKPTWKYNITRAEGKLVAIVIEEIWEYKISILGKDIYQNLQVTLLSSYSIILRYK